MNIHITLNVGLIISFIFATTLSFACNPSHYSSDHVGGPYYYASFLNNFKFPPTPSREFSHDELSEYHTYTIAYFDTEGNIINFTEILDGEVNYIYEFAYLNNKLYKSTIIRPNGTITIRYHSGAKRIIFSTEINTIVKLNNYNSSPLFSENVAGSDPRPR